MDTIEALLHDDFVMEWPQSGERFVGRHHAVGAMRSQQAVPEVAGEPRIVGSGDVWVAMMPLRYGSDIAHYVGVLELADGKIRRGTGYFGAPFPAQDYRAAFAVRGWHSRYHLRSRSQEGTMRTRVHRGWSVLGLVAAFVVASCAEPGASAAPTARATPRPTPTPAATPLYRNCEAARAASAAPLRSGQPGYNRDLDGDGDGVACE
jgi:hypothetical protein